MSDKQHTFAICAYKDSEYLECCIKSLIGQREYSDIIMCTSTPDEYIGHMADKYDIPLYIREEESDIVDDWNFAVDHVKTQWLTVAHQDDVYNEQYSKVLLEEISRMPDAVFAFTDYHPIKDGIITTDLNSRLRRFFRSPMKCSKLAHSKFWKKYILSCGNSICCPTCAYKKDGIPGVIFRSHLKFACDWETFEELSHLDAPFLYIPKVLTYYRIHEGATSMEWTVSNRREEEELYMFRKFWPEWCVKIGYRLFRISYNTYD